MPNEADYIIGVDADDVQIRVRFSTDGSAVVAFMVQLESLHSGQWKPVRRYDDHHGRPHRDDIDWRGREVHKDWLDVDRNSALTLAIQDFKSNWKAYIAEFSEGRRP